MGLPVICRKALSPARSPIAADSTYPSTPVICPAKSLFILSGYPGDVIDPSMPVEIKYEMGGTVQENKLLIDATTRWDEFPIREEWGNKRFPLSCTKVIPEIEELVKRRWEDYGL